MSSTPHNAEQPAQPHSVVNGNLIQTTNTTSGYFLGRQPRTWEIGSTAPPPTTLPRPRAPLPSSSVNGVSSHTNQVFTNPNTPVSTAAEQQPRPASAHLPARPPSTGTTILNHSFEHFIPGGLLRPNQHQYLPSLNEVDLNSRLAIPGANSPLLDATPWPANNVSPINYRPRINTRPLGLPFQYGFVNQPQARQDVVSGYAQNHPSMAAPVQATPPMTVVQAPYNNHAAAANISQGSLIHTGPMPLAWSPEVQYLPMNVDGNATRSPGNPLPASILLPEHQSHGIQGLQHAQSMVPASSIGGLASKPLIESLEARVSQLKSGKPLEECERVRINWLRVAIDSSDDFFLLLHQFTCMTADRLHDLVSFTGFEPRHLEGLQMLSRIWAIGYFNTEVISVVGDFPITVRTSQTFPGFQAWILDAKTFLDGFAWRWESLITESFRRSSPPTAREIYESLGIYHPLMSQSIFINLCCQMYSSPSSTLVSYLLILFKQDQSILLTELRSQAFRRMSDWPSLRAEADNFAKKFNMYRHLLVPQIEPLGKQLGHPPMVPDQPKIHPIRVVLGHESFFKGGQSLGSTSLNTPHPQTSTTTTNVTPVTAGANHDSAQADPDPPFFPPLRFIPPILAQPDPNRMALHQLSSIEFRQSQDDDVSSAEMFRMYMFLDHFLGKPHIVDRNTTYASWTVQLSAELSEIRAKDNPPPEKDSFAKTKRFLQNKSVTIHLRCIELMPETLSLDESLSSSSNISWPQHVFVSINENHLDFHRKGNYGKDLPCDVTHLLRQGSNEIELSYHVVTSEMTKRYAVVLEICRSYDHPNVIKLPGSVEAQSSLDSITSLLQRQNEDDDVVMSDAYISIDLIDPITAKIFDTPVRGKSCFHRECFDLDAYLKSRPCRNKDGLVLPDEWRCPICRKDARPTYLVVDQFLVQVKQKLIEDGLQDVKVISVTEDGKWVPKVTKPEQAASTAASTVENTGAPADAQADAAAPTPTKDNKAPSAIPLDNSDQVAVIVDLDMDDDEGS